MIGWSMFVTPLLAVIALAGCSERSPAVPQAALSPERDPHFFATAVEYFANRTRVPILVDPRPLRPEAALQRVMDSDLVESDSATIRMRTRVVESAGWRTTRAPDDWRCVLSVGVPPAVPHPPRADSVEARLEACRQRGPYKSLVLGPPQSGTDPAHPERWRIRAMEMLPYGYQVVDLFLERTPNGGWTVAETRVRSGIFS